MHLTKRAIACKKKCGDRSSSSSAPLRFVKKAIACKISTVRSLFLWGSLKRAIACKISTVRSLLLCGLLKKAIACKISTVRSLFFFLCVLCASVVS
ncbi:hypothetical protein KBT16_19920 [Nostoc sp. CCCryo 231-06]|nr:hypothetical protein [Nostoc sp. CCCryo 231-06]